MDRHPEVRANMTHAFCMPERVLVAGGAGMVGSAVVRHLRRQPGVEILCPARGELDFSDRRAVSTYISATRPNGLVMAAARVGGILDNAQHPVAFLIQNLELELAVLQSASEAGVARVVFLGSSCVYPRDAEQPIVEDALLSGPLEQTNWAYALAKIAGLGICRAFNEEGRGSFVSLMPSNVYGPGDNFDAERSHVVAALIRKAHHAVTHGIHEFQVWGTGMPRREFLFVDDLADACGLALTGRVPPGVYNVGVGSDVTIRELAETVASVVGFRGRITFDVSKPDGTPRKLLNTTKLAELGWTAVTPLETGLARTYAWYSAEAAHGTVRGLTAAGKEDLDN